MIIISLQVHLTVICNFQSKILQGYLKPSLYKCKCSDDSVSEEEMDLFVLFSAFPHLTQWPLDIMDISFTFRSHTSPPNYLLQTAFMIWINKQTEYQHSWWCTFFYLFFYETAAFGDNEYCTHLQNPKLSHW